MYEALIYDLRGRAKYWPKDELSLDFARIASAADALEEMNKTIFDLNAQIADLEKQLAAKEARQ